MTYLTAQPDPILDSNTRLVPQDLFRLVATSIPDGTGIPHTATTQCRSRPCYPGQAFGRQAQDESKTFRDANLERRSMPKMSPDGQAEVAECYGFVILDEECLASRRLGGHQVLCSQDMGVCNVGYVGDVPQVEPVADDKRRFPFLYACMDGRD